MSTTRLAAPSNWRKRKWQRCWAHSTQASLRVDMKAAGERLLASIELPFPFPISSPRFFWWLLRLRHCCTPSYLWPGSCYLPKLLHTLKTRVRLVFHGQCYDFLLIIIRRNDVNSGCWHRVPKRVEEVSRTS